MKEGGTNMQYIYKVQKQDLSKIEKIEPESFAKLNIWERQHIEEWVRMFPDILGEELLVVSTEFDKFDNSKNRLDLLAIDRTGNLVVIELKRDSSAEYADLQAIRYAAMVSAMTIDKLLPHYKTYQQNTLRLENITEEDLRTKILEFVKFEDFEEFTNRPRIILCSEDFSQAITTTVLWLNQFGVDITCIRIVPYQLDDKIIVVPHKIIPLQEAEEYLIDIQQKVNQSYSESPKKRKQREFWEKFKDYVSKKDSSMSLQPTSNPKWYEVYMGSDEYHVSLLIPNRENFLGCQFWIKKDKNLYKFLQKKMDEIKKISKTDETIKWADDPVNSSIEVRKEVSNEFYQKETEQSFDWLYEKAILLQNVFRKYVEEYEKQH